ncbi:hypothetical protein GCM10007216_04810 [Thalassobacillus devorans]|uniref:DNA-binding protein n=1 Tax=Thalassobacillus devorans TaxID=279813 RepID=A0ABQ1NI28_9BACI|nr:hypothetical protein [Thalassobacillus devorans]NIK27389.1 hypothetical protein [Thalassobacillus devorans]GGC77329.1 hypothetical protein GCM10007216_04810 [Thalassobacillus devorans]
MVWIALGIAAAGFFIGEGLKNFKAPDGKSLLDAFQEEDRAHELIPEKDVHNFMGISKKDANVLRQEHPDIPHLSINGNVYFPKKKLREWLLNLGK